jgi:hypothetical protein
MLRGAANTPKRVPIETETLYGLSVNLSSRGAAVVGNLSYFWALPGSRIL